MIRKSRFSGGVFVLPFALAVHVDDSVTAVGTGIGAAAGAAFGGQNRSREDVVSVAGAELPTGD